MVSVSVDGGVVLQYRPVALCVKEMQDITISS